MAQQRAFEQWLISARRQRRHLLLRFVPGERIDRLRLGEEERGEKEQDGKRKKKGGDAAAPIFVSHGGKSVTGERARSQPSRGELALAGEGWPGLGLSGVTSPPTKRSRPSRARAAVRSRSAGSANRAAGHRSRGRHRVDRPESGSRARLPSGGPAPRRASPRRPTGPGLGRGGSR